MKRHREDAFAWLIQLIQLIKLMFELMYLFFLYNCLADLQSTGAFQTSNGPRIVIGFLNDNKQNLDILNSGFGVVASAATGNEILKELFMELKVGELIMEMISLHKNTGIQSLYDAIRVLLTPDDYRVVASQVS